MKIKMRMQRENKRKKRTGECFMAGGIFFMTLALILGEYNWMDERIIKASTVEILEQIDSEIVENDETEMDSDLEEEVFEDWENVPLFEKYPDMEMPVKEIAGNYYIGRVDIPELGLSLPVMDEWSDSNLQAAPCRYQGSAYQKNMEIVAQNNKSQFGTLKNLKEGSNIIFTDMDGNSFIYEVAEAKQLQLETLEEMEEGEWALTLVTCTEGGNYCVAVYCEEAAYN